MALMARGHCGARQCGGLGLALRARGMWLLWSLGQALLCDLFAAMGMGAGHGCGMEWVLMGMGISPQSHGEFHQVPHCRVIAPPRQLRNSNPVHQTQTVEGRTIPKRCSPAFGHDICPVAGASPVARAGTSAASGAALHGTPSCCGTPVCTWSHADWRRTGGRLAPRLLGEDTHQRFQSKMWSLKHGAAGGIVAAPLLPPDCSQLPGGRIRTASSLPSRARCAPLPLAAGGLGTPPPPDQPRPIAE